MKNIALTIAPLLLCLTVACGDSGDSLAHGFTACGDFPDQKPKTCNPGQYCSDEGFSECSLGCLGDYNCEEDSQCRKPPGTDVGSCEGAPALADGGVQTNELQRCLAACSVLTSCSAIDAAEGAQCNSDCNGLSDGQRKAVADCVGDWNCGGSIPACLGIECGPAYPCGGGAQCVGGTCL